MAAAPATPEPGRPRASWSGLSTTRAETLVPARRGDSASARLGMRVSPGADSRIGAAPRLGLAAAGRDCAAKLADRCCAGRRRPTRRRRNCEQASKRRTCHRRAADATERAGGPAWRRVELRGNWGRPGGSARARPVAARRRQGAGRERGARSDDEDPGRGAPYAAARVSCGSWSGRRRMTRSGRGGLRGAGGEPSGRADPSCAVAEFAARAGLRGGGGATFSRPALEHARARIGPGRRPIGS